MYVFRNFPVSRNRAARITVLSNGCEGLAGEIKYMEHVQLVLTMSYPKRGDIQIAMKSPLGNTFFISYNCTMYNCKSICEFFS